LRETRDVKKKIKYSKKKKKIGIWKEKSI
jgi:hypothetical protein